MSRIKSTDINAVGTPNGNTFLRGDGEWAVPPGASDRTPQIRGTGSAIYFNDNTVNVTWPAGTIENDEVVIFVAHGWAASNPSGWTIIANVTGVNFNGAAWSKTMTAGDISAGSVTIGFLGSFNGVAQAVTISGLPVPELRSTETQQSGTSASTVSLISTDTAPDDLLLAFFANRANSDNTLPAGWEELSSNTDSNASSVFGSRISSGDTYSGTASASNPSNAFPGYFTVVLSFRSLSEGGSVNVFDEGAPVVTPATVLNFTGSGVTVTDGGDGEAVIDIPGGGGGGGSVSVEDNGVTIVSSASVLNFTGDVTVTDEGGGVAQVNVTGGAGGGIYIPSSITVLQDFLSSPSIDDWTLVPATRMSAAVGNSGAELTALNPAGAACIALMRPIADFGFGSSVSPGEAIVIRVTALGESSNFHITAPIFATGVSSGSGTQIWGQSVPFHPSAIGRIIISSGQYSGYNSRPSSAGDVVLNVDGSLPFWLRLVFLGSNTYRTDISVDGEFWLNGNTITNSSVMTHAGFGFTRINGSAGNGKTSIQVCGSMTGVS